PFNLTVNGSNFVSGATARAGTANRATTFVNSQQLKVAILASDIVTPGPVSITVTNPAASGGASSNSVTLFVVAPSAAIVSSLSPSSVAAGALPFKVTVVGSGFLLDDMVLVNGEPRVTEFVDSNHLVVSIPAEDVAAAGTFAVTVVRKDGKTVSSPLTFTIGNTAAPLITSLSPGNAFVGNGPFTLSIIGEGFDNAAIVSFDNTPRVTQFLSPSRLTIELSEADLAFARDVPVTVTNPGGVTSSIFQFTVGLLVPTITSISPQAVNAGDPDFTLTVTGSNFSASAVVNVNGVARPTTFISSTSLTAAISEADVSAGGTLLVSVTDHGATSAVASLTVRQPTIAAIEPGALPFGGSSATLVVSGSGFSTRSVVVFKGVDRPTTFDASTGILIATLGPSDLATPGSFGVVVRNSLNAISAPFAIQIVAPGAPAITSLDPNSVVSGNAPPLLRVLGLNFAELATVQVNGSLRATNFVNSTELDVTLLAADVAGPGQLSVVVVNPDGTRSAVAVFTVTGSSAAPARRRAVGR
ncbi:MAG: IPT/TIG domain-containing protein, partial [Acidobacteriota bacterium]